MRKAIQTAEGIYTKYGSDLERIARELSLILLEEELAGRLSEVYFEDAIVVRADLPRAVKRELIAHAIGHHLMHAGNHLTLQDNTYSFGNYHEKQANVFAAWLLVPEDELTAKLEAGRSGSGSRARLRGDRRAAALPASDQAPGQLRGQGQKRRSGIEKGLTGRKDAISM